jgi:hypothetical protein
VRVDDTDPETELVLGTSIGNFATAAILRWPRIERLLEPGKRGAP